MPTGMLTSEYAPAHPVDPALTLRPLMRGTHDPTTRIDASGVWRATVTPAGVATLRLERRADRVVASAWGPGAEWAIAGVPELLGDGDDGWRDLDVAAHPLLADALHRRPGLRLPRTQLVWESLVAAIIEQKVTGKEARQAWRTIVTRHGPAAPGPAPLGMHACPPAEVWRRIPSWELHRAGITPQRAATIMRAAPVAASLERSLALGRGGPAVERMLRSVLGVGVWTAAETMQRAHGDPDAPSVGDFHIPALVGWALVGEPVDDDGMLALLAPWAGHRQRIVRLIEVSGFVKPRFGPRLTVPEHRAR